MLPQLAFRMFHRPRLVALSGSLLLLGFLELLGAGPGKAAQTVLIKYGPIEESLAVHDLRTYGETGQASPEFADLLGLLSPETQNQIYQLLQVKKEIEPARLEQLLALERGKTILSDAAKVTQRDDPAGAQALRTSLLQGSQSSQGLSVISFLEAYPEADIAIDIVQARRFYQANQDLIAAETNTLQPIAPQLTTPTPRNNPGKLNGDRF